MKTTVTNLTVEIYFNQTFVFLSERKLVQQNVCVRNNLWLLLYVFIAKRYMQMHGLMARV